MAAVRFAGWLLLLALLPGWSRAQTLQPIPPLDSPVVDTTGTLDAQARQALEAQARALQQAKGSQLQVLMVPTTAPEDIAAFANRVGNSWKIGRREVGDGLLIVVAKDDRKMRIEVGYGLEGMLTDPVYEGKSMHGMIDRVRNGEFPEGSRVLYAHLGGVPALNAYSFLFRNG